MANASGESEGLLPRGHSSYEDEGYGAVDNHPNASINDADAEVEPREAEEPEEPMVVSSKLKLVCLAYLLIIVALGFIATTIETEAINKFRHVDLTSKNCNVEQQKTEKTISDIICYVIKCLYPITMIATIAYMHRFVLVSGCVRSSSVTCESTGRRIILVKVPRHVEMTEKLGSFPSPLVITTYLIFFVFYWVSNAIEVISRIFPETGQPVKSQIPRGLEIVRHFILMTSTLIQTIFFVVHFKKCIQWKLAASWRCMAHILAANIACWFLTVGLEVQEFEATELDDESCQSINFTTNAVPRHISPSANTSDVISRLLYPFAIEYYVMSSLMAYAMMSNIGRVGSFLKGYMEKSRLSGDVLLRAIQDLLRDEEVRNNHTRTSEFVVIQKHFCSFFAGLGAIVFALIISLYTRKQNDEYKVQQMDLVFQCALLFLNAFGIMCIGRLICKLNADGNHRVSSTHIIDRALLWLGVAAIVTNDLYSFFRTLTRIALQNEINSYNGIADEIINPWMLPYHVLLLFVCVFNIAQSTLQLYALECALMRQLRGRCGYGWRAVLNVLILINVAQWIINAVCFNFFVPKGQTNDALVLTLLTLPLQVLYRFHSAACLHEFKNHGEADDSTQQVERHPVDVEMEPPLQIDISELFNRQQNEAAEAV